jgi:hypothetical protein
MVNPPCTRNNADKQGNYSRSTTPEYNIPHQHQLTSHDWHHTRYFAKHPSSCLPINLIQLIPDSTRLAPLQRCSYHPCMSSLDPLMLQLLYINAIACNLATPTRPLLPCPASPNRLALINAVVSVPAIDPCGDVLPKACSGTSTRWVFVHRWLSQAPHRLLSLLGEPWASFNRMTGHCESQCCLINAWIYWSTPIAIAEETVRLQALINLVSPVGGRSPTSPRPETRLKVDLSML